MSESAETPEEDETSEVDPKKRGLGRGLDALFGDQDPDSVETVSRETGEAGVKTVSVADIKPSPYQPRRAFDPETIDELANSIDQHGILQPLVVRVSQTNDN